MTLFRAESITKKYGERGNKFTVLQKIDFSINPGQMMGVIGASGSGKTTLLQIFGTLNKPCNGQLYFKDQPLFTRSSKDLAAFRNSTIGFIFQFHHLLPDFTALENTMMPALIAGKTKNMAKEDAQKLLKDVELGHRLNHKVHELSGGEQQRTALARALVMKPAILLADEPTGNLDSRAGNLVFDLLYRLSRERKLSTIMVTHNTSLAKRMDKCHTLKDGLLTTTESS